MILHVVLFILGSGQVDCSSNVDSQPVNKDTRRCHTEDTLTSESSMARSTSSSHTVDQNSIPWRAISSTSDFIASTVICEISHYNMSKPIFITTNNFNSVIGAENQTQKISP